MTVRVDLNVSLDGVATPTDPTPEKPMGADWERLTAAYAAAYFQGVGAEIMGAGMFGLHAFGDDPSWTGWWGAEPPFRVPVFVLTHAPRPAVSMAKGTSFEFLSVTAAEALARARAAAGGHDVRIGGGTGVVGARLWDDLRMLESEFTVTSETAESGTIHVTFRR